MGPLKLPHESLREIVEQVKENVTEVRTCVVAGTEVRYMVCSPWPDGLDAAIYDEEGNIYVAGTSVAANRDDADLTAFHEQTEIRHKLAGRAHAYAHRRALLEELLAAKQVFVGGPDQLRHFLHRRISSYPDWKVPNTQDVEDDLYSRLATESPLKGNILDVIKESRL